MRPDAARHAARNFLDHVPFADDAVVALYHPIKDELDTGPLAEALAARGLTLALPVVVGKNKPLVFRQFERDAALTEGVYGTRHPHEKAEPADPDIIVTPLLGFTRAGGRLGYGGGFYDRTLATLKAQRAILSVGYAYGAQEVDALPMTPLDHDLDWIVTEREAICVR